MDIIKVDAIYLIKEGTKYLPGKYASKTVAQYTIDNIKKLDLDSVWNYTLSLNKVDGSVISKEDIDHFIK